ncbi:hypothetical protein U3516DRAFT_907593 [Neocallimastix sp. 'constans']
MSDTFVPSSIIKYVKTNKSIVSSLDSGKCLGRMNSNKNELRLTLNDCNNAQNDQKWVIHMVFPGSQ